MDLIQLLGLMELAEEGLRTYEERKVARYDNEESGMFVSTARPIPGDNGAPPFETAVYHPEYPVGGVTVVEIYETEEEALAGHERWVKTMTTEPLPEMLVDAGQRPDCLALDIELPGWRVTRRNEVT